MSITKETVREIKNRLDIVSVIGDYVQSLKRTGKNWVGLCPFHNDKNPSFSVSSEYGTYNCFACGEKGDVISFVQKAENLTFSEAVTLLGRRVGIDVEYNENDSQYLEKDKIISFNERVVKLFQVFLKERPDGSEARKYLQSRGLDSQTVDKFRLGYAPKGYGRLENFFINKGFTPDFLVSTGLFTQGDRGMRSLFFDRVIFPIINYKNEVVGFGGRTLTPDGKPKYVNTPETLVYKKRNNLYGLNVSKETIQKEKRVFLVEGYMDVIACHSHGLQNVVAPCGTAITSGQIKLLTRYAQEIVFLLDGDEAGMKGAARGVFETANIESVKCSVLVLPNDMDPDDYFKAFSLDDFNAFFCQRVQPIDFLAFYITKGIDLKDYTQLVKCLEYLFSFVKLWDNQIIRDALNNRIAQKLNLDASMVKNQFGEYYSKSTKQTTFNQSEAKPEEPKQEQQVENVQQNQLSEVEQAEIQLITYLVNCENYKTILQKCSFDERFLTSPDAKKLSAWLNTNELSVAKKTLLDSVDNILVKNYINDKLMEVDKLIFTEVRDDKVGDKDSNIETGSVNYKLISDNIYDRIYQIKSFYYDNLSRQLTGKIKYCELYKDEALVKELQEEKISIQKEINKLAIIKKLKNGAESNE